MALTPAEQHAQDTGAAFWRTSNWAETVHVDMASTDNERQQAASGLADAAEQMNAAWDAVQVERYGANDGWAR